MPLTEYDGDEDDDDKVDDDDEDDDDDHNGTVQCTRACASAWCLGLRRRSGRASGRVGGRHHQCQCASAALPPPVPVPVCSPTSACQTGAQAPTGGRSGSMSYRKR